MKRLILLALIFISALGLAAQEEWFWNKPVSAVQWEGLRNVDRRELDSLMKNYIGKAFTEELWMDLQSKVYELEWFESIEPAAFPADDAKTKVLIKFVVSEKPSVGQIRFTGNENLRDLELLDVVSTKVGDIYNAQAARLDELALKRHYLEKGYTDAVISSKGQASSIPGEITLSFTISEGSRVAVKAIRFTGNAALSENTLKGQMSLKEAGLFQDGAFQESKLEEDKRKIIDLYRSKGFIDVAITDVVRTTEKDPKDGRSWLFLNLVVSEGRQWLFDGISFEGNKVFASEKLASLVTLKPGTLLNYRKLMQEKARIDDLYYESGYIFNNLDLVPSRDEARGAVSYTLRIVERDRAHIESIVFKGNVKTAEHVLYRELPLQVGDIFSKEKIIAGLRNLYNLQYFSAIEPEMLPGSAENLMNLVINVEEQSTAGIEFGLTLSGFGDPDAFPLSGIVKWNDKNFLGQGRTFGIELNASPDEQSLSFTFLDNWFLDKRITLGVDLSFDHSQTVTGQDSLGPMFQNGVPDPYNSYEEYKAAGFQIPDAYKMSYEDWKFSLGFSGGYSWRTEIGDIGLMSGLTTSLNAVFYDEDKYRPALEEIREANREWLFGNKLILRAYLNRLDLSYNPGKGFYTSQRLSLAGFFDWEKQHYFRTDTKLEAFMTLFDIPLIEGYRLKWVLGGHTAFSALLPKPGYASAVVSNTDYLRIDGTFVGRGWSSLQAFNGLDLWDNWVELRMPLFPQVLSIDGFLDASVLRTANGLLKVTGTPSVDSAAPDLSSISWDNFAFSAGFGFRFIIPQFPFRFYFAQRFAFDGKALELKNNGKLDFVISISQPLN